MYIENKHFYEWLKRRGHEMTLFNKRMWFKLPGGYCTYYELKNIWFRDRKKKITYVPVGRISIEEFMKYI